MSPLYRVSNSLSNYVARLLPSKLFAHESC
ncbi:hypothetical protein COLO4_29037 [Corchorus olitorius]|uniref:Uncharacterized protein n=1 Tax=Corchorus olitorius TaxID=93759 RepID=A0A1R3HGS1_9ROSI|nr:hypothetical protein COLO4_29037 [Corchorus olitorius]